MYTTTHTVMYSSLIPRQCRTGVRRRLSPQHVTHLLIVQYVLQLCSTGASIQRGSFYSSAHLVWVYVQQRAAVRGIPLLPPPRQTSARARCQTLTPVPAHHRAWRLVIQQHQVVRRLRAVATRGDKVLIDNHCIIHLLYIHVHVNMYMYYCPWFWQKWIPSERASQEEQNGINFSSITPSSEE